MWKISHFYYPPNAVLSCFLSDRRMNDTVRLLVHYKITLFHHLHQQHCNSFECSSAVVKTNYIHPSRVLAVGAVVNWVCNKNPAKHNYHIDILRGWLVRENEKRCYAPPLFILRRATEDATLVRVRDWQINGIFTSFINILGQLPKRAANKTHTGR